MIPEDGMAPTYLINPLILERFRNRPEEWRREWMTVARKKNFLDLWVNPATEESVEACAALLWWVSYRGANYPTENYPVEQQPGGGDHADTLGG